MRPLIVAILIGLLQVASLSNRAMAQAGDLPPVAQEAIALFKQGKFSEALTAAEKWIAETPGDIRAYGMGANIAVFARDGAKAVSIAKKSVEMAPDNPTIRANLVLAYQLTGQAAERDRELDELYKLRNAIPDPSRRPPVFIRDSFDHDGKKVLVTEAFELQGQRAVKYVFNVSGPSGPPIYRISFGSYESTNRVARELGQIKEGQRLYHLDRYFPDNKHETLGFFSTELPYEDVKAMASETISGKRGPMAAPRK